MVGVRILLLNDIFLSLNSAKTFRKNSIVVIFRKYCSIFCMDSSSQEPFPTAAFKSFILFMHSSF